MTLPRYFRRAHDEAERLLRDMPWLRTTPPMSRPMWSVVLGGGASVIVGCGTTEEAALAALADVPQATVLHVARMPPVGLCRVIERAMIDIDGGPTLTEPGDGAEARRLLGMVAWERVPHARWPEVLDRLRTAVRDPGAWLEHWLRHSGISAAERLTA